MADANQAAEDLARAMAKVTEELALLGRTTQQTQTELKDAQMKAKYGIENYSKGTEKAAEGVMALGKAGFAAGKAMLDGKKGAAALNSSLDDLSTAATAAGAALALMIPGGFLIKGIVAGFTMAAAAAIKYGQAANEMADQLYKGYTGLAKAGGAAADGMTGLKQDAQKLGLAMGELDQMVSLVTENSKEFALFAGSVSDGRKKFADMGQAMAPARQEFLNMGMEVKDINEGMAGYVRLQTRLGNAQKMSVDQLAKGAQEYLKEQDMLTKLTGQTRAEMEQQRERALQGEQFAAKIRQLQLEGDAGKAAAEKLLKLNSIYEAAGPAMASAFQASVTGNLANVDAQKANFASNGEMIRSTQQVIDNQISYQEAAQRTGKEMGKTADSVGTTLGQFNAYNTIATDLSQTLKLAQMANGDIVANAKKIQEDQAKQRAGAGDQLVKNQTDIIQAQIAANKAMTDFVFEGIEPAQKSMIALTKATGMAAQGLANIASGSSDTERKKTTDEAKQKGTVNQNTTNDYGMDFGQLSGADGGIFKGPASGYPVLMHGTEAIIPMDKLTGANKMSGLGQFGMGNNSAAGAQGAEQLEKIVDLYADILKDTIALDKLNDADLKRKKEYDRLSTQLMNLKMDVMKDEISALSSGDASDSGLQWKSGSGAPITSGSGAPVMSGGGAPTRGMSSSGSSSSSNQGAGSSLTDLLQFGSASGSASNFEGLNDRLKTAVINAASEYNSLTGNKLKINSAKRDSDDQVRLYQETVEAGRPGIGPNGMPVGRPGTSSHEKGLAVDIQNYNDPAAISALNRQGLQQVVPKDPVHFQLSGETGMIADGPTSGYQATLHGKEAVIPMQNNSGDFVKMFEAIAESSARMADMMEQMVSAQKNSVDVQTKMLRAQS